MCRHCLTPNGATLPALTPELIEQLMVTYCSGYMSGTAATLASVRDTEPGEDSAEVRRLAQRVAQSVVDRMWRDPLIRDGIERACRAAYTGGPEVSEWGHIVNDDEGDER